MNDHSLDDLIIGVPSPVAKKSKSMLVIIALAVIVLLIGIFLSKIILGTSDDIIITDNNKTEFVSPDLMLLDENLSNNNEDDLKPIATEKLPEPSSQKQKKKEKIKSIPPKKKEKPKESNVKPKQNKEEKPKETPKKVAEKKKPTKPSALFADGRPMYFVQVGAFNKEPNPKFLNKIKSAGFQYIVNVNEKTRRVRVGPYGSYSEAKGALVDINSTVGVVGFVVKQK